MRLKRPADEFEYDDYFREGHAPARPGRPALVEALTRLWRGVGRGAETPDRGKARRPAASAEPVRSGGSGRAA